MLFSLVLATLSGTYKPRQTVICHRLESGMVCALGSQADQEVIEPNNVSERNLLRNKMKVKKRNKMMKQLEEEDGGEKMKMRFKDGRVRILRMFEDSGAIK